MGLIVVSARVARRPPIVLARLHPVEGFEHPRIHRGSPEKLLARLPDDVVGTNRVCRFCDVDACGHYDGRCPVAQRAEACSLRG
jgi:hypothetical protein